MKEQISICRRCQLWKTRTKTVAGEFPEDAEPILFVSDGPNGIEDAVGKPLQGYHGTQFSHMVYDKLGLKRGSYNISYCVKCIPYSRDGQRRSPNLTSLFWCADYIYQQIEILQPKLIVTMGFAPFYVFLGRGNDVEFTTPKSRKIGDHVGHLYEATSLISQKKLLVFPTYDPLSWNRSKTIRAEAHEHFEAIGKAFNDIKSGKSIQNLIRNSDVLQ